MGRELGWVVWKVGAWIERGGWWVLVLRMSRVEMLGGDVWILELEFGTLCGSVPVAAPEGEGFGFGWGGRD